MLTVCLAIYGVADTALPPIAGLASALDLTPNELLAHCDEVRASEAVVCVSISLRVFVCVAYQPHLWYSLCVFLCVCVALRFRNIPGLIDRPQMVSASAKRQQMRNINSEEHARHDAVVAKGGRSHLPPPEPTELPPLPCACMPVRHASPPPLLRLSFGVCMCMSSSVYRLCICVCFCVSLCVVV